MRGIKHLWCLFVSLSHSFRAPLLVLRSTDSQRALTTRPEQRPRMLRNARGSKLGTDGHGGSVCATVFCVCVCFFQFCAQVIFVIPCLRGAAGDVARRPSVGEVARHPSASHTQVYTRHPGTCAAVSLAPTPFQDNHLFLYTCPARADLHGTNYSNNAAVAACICLEADGSIVGRCMMLSLFPAKALCKGVYASSCLLCASCSLCYRSCLRAALDTAIF